MRYIRDPAGPYGSATNRSAVRPGRSKYPRATPVPAMCSSPTTPGGSRPRCRSRTYPRVVSSGVPIRGAPSSSARTVAVVDQTVVSVGPYRFTTSAPSASSRRASGEGSASPPLRTRTPDSTLGGSSPSDTSPSTACHSVGVACAIDTAWRSISPSRAAGSRVWPAEARTTRAPATSGMNHSTATTSNDGVEAASTASDPVSGVRRAMARRNRPRPLRDATTPLGLPVEPEV